MKKSKPKTKPAETPAENKPLEKPVVLNLPLRELPTAEYLATIAATLARNTTDKPEALVNKAYWLWLAARRAIYEAEEWDELFCPEEIDGHFPPHNWPARSAVSYGFGFDDDYPVTRDRFLQKVLPQYKARADQLAQIGKAFVRAVLLDRNKKEPTQEDVDNAYGRWKPSSDEKQANARAERFRKWYGRYKSEVQSVKGKLSAASTFLNKCPDIKKGHKEKLLKNFKSIQLLLAANLEQLTTILGDKTKAENVKGFLEKHAQAVAKKS